MVTLLGLVFLSHSSLMEHTVGCTFDNDRKRIDLIIMIPNAQMLILLMMMLIRIKIVKIKKSYDNHIDNVN